MKTKNTARQEKAVPFQKLVGKKSGIPLLTKCSEAVGLRAFSRMDTKGRTCSNTHRSRNRPPSTLEPRKPAKQKGGSLNVAVSMLRGEEGTDCIVGGWVHGGLLEKE